MNVSLYQAASALNANARWQEVISENMASASIPGFKKQELTFEAVRAGMLSPNKAGATSSPVSLPATRTHLNFSPGDVRRTDGNTDFAIEGKGFFEVQLPSGNSAYTRDGEFKLNAQGQLVTKQGYLVMGEGGPIQLDRSLSTGMTVAPLQVMGGLPAVNGAVYDDPQRDPTVPSMIWEIRRERRVELEAQLAARFVEHIPSAEKVLFCNSGSEAASRGRAATRSCSATTSGSFGASFANAFGNA